MTQLTPQQATQYAQQAGFTGSSLQTIVAIAMCESGLNTTATNTSGNTPPSTDRGIVQINSYWHKEVSDSCAFNPACAFVQAYRISNGGTSFSPWTTYTNGCYKSKLAQVKSNIPNTNPQTNNSNSGSGDGGIFGSIKSSIINLAEEVAVFLIALLIILIGVMLLAGKQIAGFTTSEYQTT